MNPLWRNLATAAKLVFILLAMVFLSITTANAKDYYIAQNGIYANDGSEKKPWRTIRQAAVPPKLETPYC